MNGAWGNGDTSGVMGAVGDRELGKVVGWGSLGGAAGVMGAARDEEPGKEVGLGAATVGILRSVFGSFLTASGGLMGALKVVTR